MSKIEWRRFHSKYLQSVKLSFVSRLHRARPGKLCWADCVAWAYSPHRFNPFRIDNAKGCAAESLTHMNRSCYCGIWNDGTCFDLLPKSERDALIKQAQDSRTDCEDDLPF